MNTTTLKVGDRVKITKCERWTGQTGTITHVLDCTLYNFDCIYRVELDRFKGSYHLTYGKNDVCLLDREISLQSL